MTTTPHHTPSVVLPLADSAGLVGAQRWTSTELAEQVAVPARQLRDQLHTLTAGTDIPGPLRTLTHDYPDRDTFASQAAQMTVYGLLLNPTVPADNDSSGPGWLLRLLARTVDTMWHPQVCVHVARPLGDIAALIDATDTADTAGDVWWHFHEQFLEAFDPQARRNTGAWYTPTDVIDAQLRLVDDALASRFNLTLASEQVQLVDPALGTGSYLLRAAAKVTADQPATPPEQIARRMVGYELDPVAATVASLRLGERVWPGHPPVQVTDTLTVGDLPNGQLSLLAEPGRRQPLPPVADGHMRVVVGNPPYLRGNATDRIHPDNLVLSDQHGNAGLLADYLHPSSGKLSAGGNNLYNLYVYFWRWATWAAAEQPDTRAGTVVSLVTPSSFLTGAAFNGMREHLTAVFDELWVIDCGGEQIRRDKDPNILGLNTPVAVTVAVRYPDNAHTVQPAMLRYHRLSGTRSRKLTQLSQLSSLDSADTSRWATVDTSNPARPLVVSQTGSCWHTWPTLRQLFPWSHSGVQWSRRWPVAPDPKALQLRWQALTDQIATGDIDHAQHLFHRTRDRTLDTRPRRLDGDFSRLPALTSEHGRELYMQPVAVAYRSFDQQWCLPDPRVADRITPVLWATHSDRQTYLASPIQVGVARSGPAITATSVIPDNHHYCGSCAGNDTIPLWRDSAATVPNVPDGLAAQLADIYGRPVTVEDIAAYTVGLLGTGAYTRRHHQHLTVGVPRVPVTADTDLFDRAVQLGQRLLSIATGGDRGTPLPPLTGDATLAQPTSRNVYPDRWAYDPAQRQLVLTADGDVTTVIDHVSEPVATFDVGGMRVVNSWLKYRMRMPGGRTCSPLDLIQPPEWRFDTQLVELLWTVEHMIAVEPQATWLLDQIEGAPTVPAQQLPTSSERQLRPPKPARQQPTQPVLF